ncbi:MAG: methyltransferase domain-containing protein [Aestuariivirga sp.]|uniref:methyltransferase domain-containing protein n=1 Tax=Aestuariivirga sp. TaxID=2650926 RepID=UPI0025C4D097|nr:methyltransferase domain-containing protein [Aestuariivirga sp.]MCA3560350.1 methyltransferase domain-containing protein [Aestuariivirga sp.]
MAGAPHLFDRALAATRAARRRGPEPNILTRTIAEELVERVAFVNRRFERVLLIAAEPEAIAGRLKEGGQVKEVEMRLPSSGDRLGLPQEQFDAVFSVLDLQTFNDVPGALIQMRHALKPDGLLLVCLFAGDTLTELRQSWLAAEVAISGGVTPRVAPMIDVRELGALLQRAGLALPVADLDRTMVRYSDAVALIHEIRELGLSNNLVGRSRVPVSRRLMGAAINHYQQNFADPDDRVRATIEIAWLTGWAPHESQQQPLKPGSAKARLADALKVDEKKLR